MKKMLGFIKNKTPKNLIIKTINFVDGFFIPLK
jgi:hypothetical protein